MFIGAFTLKDRLLRFEATHYDLPESYYYVALAASIIGIAPSIVGGYGLWKLRKWGVGIILWYEYLHVLYTIIIHIIYIFPHTIPYLTEQGIFPIIAYSKPVADVAWVVFLYSYLNKQIQKGIIK